MSAIDCEAVFRRSAGPGAVELAIPCVPAGDERPTVVQAERRLDDVASLLIGHGATFDEPTSGVIDPKHASDAPLRCSVCRRRGCVGFPCAVVEAALCRPELLCETEVVAMLPPVTQAA